MDVAKNTIDRHVGYAINAWIKKAQESGRTTPEDIYEFIRENTQPKYPMFWNLFSEDYGIQYIMKPVFNEKKVKSGIYRIQPEKFGHGYSELLIEGESKAAVRRFIFEQLNDCKGNEEIKKAFVHYPKVESLDEFKKVLEEKSYWLENHPFIRAAMDKFIEGHESFESFGQFLKVHFGCAEKDLTQNDCKFCHTFTHTYDTRSLICHRGSKWISVELMSILQSIDHDSLVTPYSVIKIISKELGLPFMHKYKVIKTTSSEYAAQQGTVIAAAYKN